MSQKKESKNRKEYEKKRKREKERMRERKELNNNNKKCRLLNNRATLVSIIYYNFIKYKQSHHAISNPNNTVIRQITKHNLDCHDGLKQQKKRKREKR